MQDMEIPIYIDGQQEGTVRISHDGPATVLDADLRDVGRVVRLRLFGDEEGYLGVPEPKEGRLRLIKRVSPIELRRLPAFPKYAAESRMQTQAEPEPEPESEPGPETKPAPRHVLWQGGRPYYF